MVVSCPLCLENFKIYDLMKVTDCGHCFHNYCFLKYNNNKCAICRKELENVTEICFATDTDTNILDPSSREFRNLVDFNSKNKELIIYKKKIEDELIEYEILKEQEKLFRKFVKENILSFRFKILKASAEGKKECSIYTCKFHQNYENLSVLYMLKGPKNDGLQFFRKKSIKSVIDLIRAEFQFFDVIVHSDYEEKKNSIVVYFGQFNVDLEHSSTL